MPLKGENMDSRERFNSCIRGEPVDRTPVFLFDLSLGMDVLNVPTTDIYCGRYNGELAGKCILALQRMMGHDAVAGSYQSIDFSAFGATMVYPPWGVPYMTKAAFGDPECLYKHSPEEIQDHMSGSKASFSTIRSNSPDTALLMNIPTALSIASSLRGLEPFLMDLFLDPSYTEELISFGGEVSRISIEEVSSAVDLDAVLLTGSSDNVNMIGPDALRKHSFGKLKNSINRIHNLGLPVVFHPHGAFAAHSSFLEIYDEIISMGCDCLYYGESNDPAILSKRSGCTLMGGIDSFSALYLGPDEEVVREVREHMSRVSGNFIFTCSCSVDRGLPLDRIKIMIDTVKDIPYWSASKTSSDTGFKITAGGK